jgi:hypothetical protein
MSGNYLPSYYSSSQLPATGNTLNLPTLLSRGSETTQRRRPKHTRSKTGCMTCRQKKIKVRPRHYHGQHSHFVLKLHFFFPFSVTRISPSATSVCTGNETWVYCPMGFFPVTSHTSSSGSQFHAPSSHHSNLSVIPVLSNSYLTLPPMDQLYTPAPQQQYSSSAPLGGVPRVAQTSGSGYRYYENMQSVNNWMPQAPSHLEPMDSYVRTPLPVIAVHFPNVYLSSVQFHHAQDRFSAGTSSSDTQPSRYH